jgi:cbb3-type cytochrome oxidase cytochrome c subunit
VKEFAPLILGILGTLTFSWAGLTVIPNLQIGHLDPQTDEEGNDAYPAPRSGMAERGRKIYAANGCVYCHSQQVRPDYAGSDLERKWGQRRSAPRDYIFDTPVLLGRMRMGPDLANVGHRAPVEDENAPAPSATNTATAGQPAPAAGAPPLPAGAPAPGASPATTGSPVPAGSGPAGAAPGSGAPAASPPPAPAASPAASATAKADKNVPNATTSSSPQADAAAQAPSPRPTAPSEVTTAVNGTPLQYSSDWHHRHLYDPRSITRDSNMPSYRFLYEKRKVDGQRAADALKFTGRDVPEEGYEIVPTYDAQCLVAYLMSLDQSHELKEVKSAAPISPPAPGKAPAK